MFFCCVLYLGTLLYRVEWVIMSFLVGGDVLLVCPVSGCLIHRVE